MAGKAEPVPDEKLTAAAMVRLPPYRLTAIEELEPYEGNARTHTDAQVEKIAASIREFGFTNPVLIDRDGGIIAGHGRVLAAELLGLEKVPTIRLSHLSDAQRRAYIIADNRLALDAGWDDELLALELGALRDDGFNIALTGFEPDELTKLFADVDPPADFDEYDEGIETAHQCPKCGYRWSGGRTLKSEEPEA